MLGTLIIYTVDLRKLGHMEVLDWPVLKSCLGFKLDFNPDSQAH